jgi:hypothetical protein
MPCQNITCNSQKRPELASAKSNSQSSSSQRSQRNSTEWKKDADGDASMVIALILLLVMSLCAIDIRILCSPVNGAQSPSRRTRRHATCVISSKSARLPILQRCRHWIQTQVGRSRAVLQFTDSADALTSQLEAAKTAKDYSRMAALATRLAEQRECFVVAGCHVTHCRESQLRFIFLIVFIVVFALSQVECWCLCKFALTACQARAESGCFIIVSIIFIIFIFISISASAD